MIRVEWLEPRLIQPSSSACHARPMHVSAILTDLHWLKAPERIRFKLVSSPIVACTARCSTIPHFTTVCRIADIQARRLLRSSAAIWPLAVCRDHRAYNHHRRSCLCDVQLLHKSGTVSMPASVKAAPSLTAFRRQLKANLFRQFGLYLYITACLTTDFMARRFFAWQKLADIALLMQTLPKYRGLSVCSLMWMISQTPICDIGSQASPGSFIAHGN
jgi:hypothetical protein